MQATLTFDLSTEDGRAEHADALNGSRFKSILWELDNHLRSVVKYDDKRSQKEIEVYEEVRAKLWELLNEEGLDII